MEAPVVGTWCMASYHNTSRSPPAVSTVRTEPVVVTIVFSIVIWRCGKECGRPMVAEGCVVPIVSPASYCSNQIRYCITVRFSIDGQASLQQRKKLMFG